MANPLLAGAPALTRPNREPRSHRLIDAAREDATEMEQQADALLGRCVLLGSDSGIYAQNQLDRKMRDEGKRMPLLAECGVPDEMVDYLVERQMEDLIDAASLTAFQEIVYRLHVSGLSVKRIAEASGVRRGTIEQRLRTVKRRVRAAYEQGRYAGWYEVYLSEVNRPAYRRRK